MAREVLEQQYVYSMHGPEPTSPEMPGFTSGMLENIWTLFWTSQVEIWGRRGLGRVVKSEYQYGYDLHVLFFPEGTTDMLDCWIWRDSVR